MPAQPLSDGGHRRAEGQLGSRRVWRLLVGRPQRRAMGRCMSHLQMLRADFAVRPASPGLPLNSLLAHDGTAAQVTP